MNIELAPDSKVTITCSFSSQDEAVPFYKFGLLHRSRKDSRNSCSETSKCLIETEELSIFEIESSSGRVRLGTSYAQQEFEIGDIGMYVPFVELYD